MKTNLSGLPWLWGPTGLSSRQPDLGFQYEARFRRNGVIIIVNGAKRSVAEILDPLLRGPRLYQSVQTTWQTLAVFVTAHKHRNHSGDAITYTISNRKVTAAQHTKDYLLRWGIEMFFRTAKQSLGLQHCASADIAMQRAHIQACLVAYVFLQRERVKRRYRSVEEALHALRTAGYFSPDMLPLAHADQLNTIFA